MMRFFVKYRIVFIALMLGILSPNSAVAKFGSGGKVITDIQGADYAQSLVLQPDGKLVAAGYCGGGGGYQFALARYTSNGSLDASFGTAGKVTTDIGNKFCSKACSLVLQPDGKLVAAGFTAIDSNMDFALARYTSDGNLDPSFGNGGKVTTNLGHLQNMAYGLILQPDGKLVAAGYSNSDFALVRYMPNGSLDTSFGMGGQVVADINGSDFGQALILQPDGKFVMAGFIYGADFALARFTSTGSLDPSFGTGGKVITDIGTGTNDAAYCLILQPDGKLVEARRSAGTFALTRYNSNGGLDTSFGTGGKVTTPIGNNTDVANSLILQPDGKLVAAGSSYNGANVDDFTLVRYTSNGSLDTSFGTGGKVTTDIGTGTYDYIQGLILQSDGKLVAAGYSANGGNYDFALVRYTSNGNLDIQDDLPSMTEIKPNHALVGQTVTLDIRGWNLEDVIGVQLRNANASINGSGLVATGTRILAQFTLPVASGFYDLYLAKNTVNKTFLGAFSSLDPLTQPLQWQVQDLKKAGTPIFGTAGITIGEADSSGQQALFVGNSDTRLYMYKNSTSWSISALPLQAGYFHDVILADVDHDGINEVYGANAYPCLFQFQWNGTSWNGNSFCAYGGPLATGSQVRDAVGIYSLVGSYVTQSCWSNQVWTNSLMSPSSGAMLCSTVGDANNDGVNEVYAANTDNRIYQFEYFGTCWSRTAPVYTGTNNMTCLATGDLDQDGKNELYGSSLDGKIYQFKWNGAAWLSQPINTMSLAVNKIAINDGDNDGNDELYAANQDGHAYQFKRIGVNWQMTDMGTAGSPLIALAVGDGDNSNQYKIYAVGADAHVYQFYATGTTPTVSPTLVITSTPEIPVFEKRLKVMHSQINPLQGERAMIRWFQFKDNPVKVTIYNLLGDKVANLAVAAIYQANRFYEVPWSGKTDRGVAAVFTSSIWNLGTIRLGLKLPW